VSSEENGWMERSSGVDLGFRLSDRSAERASDSTSGQAAPVELERRRTARGAATSSQHSGKSAAGADESSHPAAVATQRDQGGRPVPSSRADRRISLPRGANVGEMRGAVSGVALERVTTL